MRRGLPLVALRGNPREQGRQHGSAAQARVASNVHTYLRRFTEWGKIPREDVRRRAEAYREAIEAANPDYAAAMAGIAEGSGQDLLDIVAVNVRYELMYSEFAERGKAARLAGPLAAGGCTSFALLPRFASNGHLVIGQNWDWIPEAQGLVVRTGTEGGLEGLAFTEAGIAGAKIGLNSAGVGLAINGLVSDMDSWARLGKPFHVRCWEILAARTLQDAERAASDGRRACSANFLLAQAGDPPQVVDVEVAPESACRVLPARGFLAHTNHFSDAEALGISQPLAEERPSTLDRLARIEAVLNAFADRGETVGLDDLKAMLRDHTGAPNSLCRHADLGLPADDRYETVVSVILDLDAREMHIASGPPCTSRYRCISLTPSQRSEPPRPTDRSAR